MNQTIAASICLAMFAGAPATAFAQDAEGAPAAESTRDERALELLQNARTALDEASSLSLTVNKAMVKTEDLAPENAVFASISIGARGTIRAAKDADNRWVYRIDGTGDDIGKADAFEITVLRGPVTVSWLDQASNTLVKANYALARSREVGYEGEFGVRFLFGEPLKKPFEGLMNAPTMEVLEPEMVDGVLCDVVACKYGRKSDSGDHRVYIGSSDGLPRRIDEILVIGFESRYHFSYSTPDAPITPEALEIDPPEGWDQAYRPESLRPGYRPEARFDMPGTVAPTDAPGEDVGYGVGNVAPAFTGFTMLGEEVGSDAIEGKPSVLAFWASWVPNSDKIVQFASDTLAEHGDSVGLVTFAVRERSPDVAFNMLNESDAADVPLLVDANDAVVAFGVTRAPTVLVIDSEGVIQYRQDVFDASATIDEVNAKLTELLAE